jgi:hypothetical protein
MVRFEDVLAFGSWRHVTQRQARCCLVSVISVMTPKWPREYAPLFKSRFFRSYLKSSNTNVQVDLRTEEIQADMVTFLKRAMDNRTLLRHELLV